MRDEVRVERRERREDVADLRKDFTRKLSDLAVQIDRKRETGGPRLVRAGCGCRRL